jgi:hypothetical protein
MTERWCKLYPHALTDPMWLAVADDADVAPGLVGATFVELLTWTTEHAPETGSIAGFDARVWAAWLRIAPDAVERIIASLRKFGRLVGDAIAHWVTRQGAAAVAMVRKVSTPRTRRYRQRQRDRRQLEMLLPLEGTQKGVPGTLDPVPGNAENGSRERGGNAKTAAISMAGTHGNAGTPERESEREEESFVDSKRALVGRSAPLDAWLRQRKREALQSKLWRFINATMAGAGAQAAYAGLLADDPAESQRWLDRLDREMRARGWNDAKASA